MKGIKTVALRHPLKCSAQISERAFEETDAALPPPYPHLLPERGHGLSCQRGSEAPHECGRPPLTTPPYDNP